MREPHRDAPLARSSPANSAGAEAGSGRPAAVHSRRSPESEYFCSSHRERWIPYSGMPVGYSRRACAFRNDGAFFSDRLSRGLSPVLPRRSCHPLRKQAVPGAGVVRIVIVETHIVCFTLGRICFTVKEGDESVAPASRDRRNLVQCAAQKTIAPPQGPR